jgi:hypothetical protein
MLYDYMTITFKYSRTGGLRVYPKKGWGILGEGIALPKPLPEIFG